MMGSRRLSVDAHSGYLQRIFTVDVHSGYLQWIFTVDIHSGCSQRIFTGDVHSGYSQLSRLHGKLARVDNRDDLIRLAAPGALGLHLVHYVHALHHCSAGVTKTYRNDAKNVAPQSSVAHCELRAKTQVGEELGSCMNESGHGRSEESTS